MDGAAWATTYHIVYKGDAILEDSVRHIIETVDHSLSPFNGNSNLARINSNRDLTVDSLFSEVFGIAQYVARISSGAFDPTVAPAVNLWGFGYRTEKNPTDETIDSIKKLVGIGECRIIGGKIEKKSPQMEFNFSAIAKGYGCDLIGRMFRRNGVCDYMVEIGGEVCVSGHSPSNAEWKIMIVTPEQGVDGRNRILVSLTDGGMATSGNYRNFRDTDTGRIGHTINPVTCRPVVTPVFSATVIAPSTVLADALATASMVLAPDASIAMIESVSGVELLLIVEKSPGKYVLEMTDGFKNLIYGNQNLHT